MWFWQRKSMHKQLKIWAQLATVSVSLHLFFLFGLFAWYRDPYSALALIIRRDAMRRDVVYTVNIEEPLPKEKSQQKAVAQKREEKKEVSKQAEPAKKVPEAAQKKQETAQQNPLEERYFDLYKKVSQNWSPPPGIPSDTACELTMQIDGNGKLADMQISKSSGLLLFDLAAQAAIDELDFPKWASGKSISLTFSMEMA